MARIEIYGNDSNVTLDDKVIGTDALDNSTKNFTVGDILALGGGGGTTYTAGTGITIANGVISSTVVDTDTNNFVSNVVLNGTDLDFTGTGGAFQSSVSLSTIADKTVSLTGTGGIAITGTYPSFTIDGSGISGGTTYTAGVGIDITNNVISSTVVDTDTNTTYDYGAVGAAGNISFALNGSDGTNDVVTMQAGSKITLTDNGNSVFTVDHSIIGTSKTTNTTALVSGGTFKAIDAVTYSDGHLTQYREQTYTLPAAASPETLISRIVPNTIGLVSQDLLFSPTGTLVKTNSLHINPVELVPDTSGVEVVNACTAKVSLGAYIDNGPQNQAGQIIFEIQEVISGTATSIGNVTFDIQNQVGIIPITFISFFDFQAGATYIFKAQSFQHAMDIFPGSFIQIEILK